MFTSSEYLHFRLHKEKYVLVAVNPAAEKLLSPFLLKIEDYVSKDSSERKTIQFCGSVELAETSYGIIQQEEGVYWDLFLIPSSEKTKSTIPAYKYNSFFEDILDNSSIDIAVFNENFQYVYVSKSAIKNDDIQEWIIGKTDIEYCAYRNKDASVAYERRKAFDSAWNSQKEIEWEEEQILPNGSTKYFVRRVTPVVDKNGKTAFLIGYGMDFTDLKKARTKLLISEGKYRHIVEASSDIIYSTNAEGQITYVNKFAESIIGFSVEEIVGQYYLKFIHHDFRDQVEKFYISQVESRQENSYLEFPIATKDGSEIWVGQRVRMVFGSTAFLGVQAIARDISERKATEHQLLALISSLDDIVMEVDEKFHFLNVWAGDENELFVPKAEFIGKTIREVLGFEFSRPFEVLVSKVVSDGISRTLEYKHPDNEKWYSVKMNLLTINNANEKRISLLIRNVTEIKIAQEKLIQSQKNLVALIENTNDIVYSLDTNYCLLSFNSRFAEIEKELYNWNAEIGMPLHFHLQENDLKMKWVDIYNNTFNGTSNQVDVTLFLGKKKFIFEYSLSPIRDNNGVIGIAVFGRDITNRKMAEKQILRAQKIAVRSIKAREQFIANMSHELRTPINTIMGSALLLKDSPLEASQSQYLSVIQDSSRFLLSMINDVLDLSKIDAGQITIEKVSFTFEEIKRALIATFEKLAKEKNIRLEIICREETLSKKYIGDPQKFKQVLINLIGNALKFTEAGFIQVTISEFPAEPNWTAFSISIKDSGMGISPEQLSKIFKPFGQGSEQISKKYGGSGLGLIISQKIIEAMFGTITVESKLGEGATFHLNFQLPLDLSVHETQSLVETNSSTEKHCILLVEDHEFNRFFLKKILIQKGFDVFDADSGKNALEILKQNPQIKLVLLDLRMPDWDGYYTNRKIKEFCGDKLPVVALTAYTLKEEQAKCFKEGFVDFVVKPVEPEILEAIILKILKKTTMIIQFEPELHKSTFSLEGLKNIFETEESMKEIVLLFITNTEQFILELKTMNEKKDYIDLYALLHKLKPMAALFNIAELEAINEMYHGVKVFSDEEGASIATDSIRILNSVCTQLRKDD